MTRLIGIPGDKATTTIKPHHWINPDHIVQLTPIVDSTGLQHRLLVEIKLVGLPIVRAHFGTYESLAAVDAKWQEFLGEVDPR